MRKNRERSQWGKLWVILFTVGSLASACHNKKNHHHGNTDGNQTGLTTIDTLAPRSLPRTEIPSDCHVIGTMAKALGWDDSNGDNIAVLTATTAQPFVSDEYPEETKALKKELHAYHYVRNATGLRLLSHFKVHNIAFCNDRIIDYYGPTVRVTDVDKDGEAELSFMYVNHELCDLRDVEVTFLLQHKGVRYTMSGHTRIFSQSSIAYSTSFATAPAVVARFMRDQWEKFIPKIGAEIAHDFG